jgi:hypothetical protein
VLLVLQKKEVMLVLELIKQEAVYLDLLLPQYSATERSEHT